jgi:hypothetical protein
MHLAKFGSETLLAARYLIAKCTLELATVPCSSLTQVSYYDMIAKAWTR